MGDILLGRFRLVQIGNNTAELEETGSGRHATLNMTVEPGVLMMRAKHMRPRRTAAAGSRPARPLLMAVFLVGESAAVHASMAVPSVLNQGLRERDEEAIWRGKQYLRAIRLYHQKNGRYPQTISTS